MYIKTYRCLPDEDYSRNTSCALNLISTITGSITLLLDYQSLGYHLPSSQCFGSDGIIYPVVSVSVSVTWFIRYIYY